MTLDLKPGDPFTFICFEPIRHPSGENIAEGDTISKWFATNEPGRMFKVGAVRVVASPPRVVYETTFAGFEPEHQ